MTPVRLPLLARRGATDVPGRADVLALCSVLLGYPDDDLLAVGDDLAAAVRDLPDSVPAGHLRRFWAAFAALDPATARARYVEAFDLRRSTAPYLSYYLHGDTRRRGLALLAIKQQYRACGFDPPEDELPDHLPLVLEFAARAGPGVGEGVLRRHRAGLEVIRRALAERGSEWAAVLDAVDALLGPLPGGARAAADEHARTGAPADTVGADLPPHPYGPDGTPDAACPTTPGGR